MACNKFSDFLKQKQIHFLVCSLFTEAGEAGAQQAACTRDEAEAERKAHAAALKDMFTATPLF